MTAKEYLSQYRTLNARINAKLAQAERLRHLAQSAGGQNYSGDAHSTQPRDKVGELTAKIVDLEIETNDEIGKLVDLEREIRDCISTLASANQRAVLEMKYINGLTMKQIADKMNYSVINIRKIHYLALEHVVLPCS